MDNSYKKPVPFIASRREIAPWRFVVCLGNVIIVALREFTELEFLKLIQNDFSDLNAHGKKLGMRDAQSPNVPVGEVKTELLHSISETRALFSEVIKSLDLFENYIQRPSEKTAKRLKLSLDHRKDSEKEQPSPNRINELADIFRTYLGKICSDNLKYKDEKDNNSKQKIANWANKNLQYDSEVESQPRSISPYGNKFDHASNHDNHEINFRSKIMNGNESNDKKVSITRIQNNEENGERFSSAQLKQPQKINLTPAKNSKLHEKDEFKSREHKINKSSGMEDETSSLAINGQDVKKIRWYSGKETLLLHEEIMGEKVKKNLEDENNHLKEKLKLLEIKHKELLADIGECGVREMAKERKERKSELFLKMNASNQPETRKEPDYQTASTSDDHPQINSSLPCPIVSGEKFVQINDQKLERNHGKKEMTNDKDENESHGVPNSGTGTNLSCNEKEIPAVQNSSKETKNSGEELNLSGTGVNGANVMASTGRESLIEQSDETLPYSVQQDYSNAPEYINLKHIPPASVAASLYNNYMFLLLSLAQNLLSSDVVKLKVWAAQRFSIDNPQNATDVLIKLDQKGFIHASDLSQLRDFFESILRIDLVCVIDAFLLGDYSVLHEISTSKKLDVNRSQTQQNTASSRYQNILSSVLNPGGSSFKPLNNASSISQRSGKETFPTSTGSRSKNESKIPVTHQTAASNSWNTSKLILRSRSPNENQTLKNGEKNICTSGSGTSARVTDTVVTDTFVSSKFSVIYAKFNFWFDIWFDISYAVLGKHRIVSLVSEHF